MKLLTSKLLPPCLDENIIDRPRLIGKIILPEQEPGVVIFNAPAGYGKTILMSQYCNATGKPVIWYQIDSYDDSPGVFLKNLTAAIKQYLPDFGERLLPMINKPGVFKKQRQIITALFQELSIQTEQKLIIALDDYHSIAEAAMHSFMEEFIYCLPAEIQLCLASRTALPFSISRLSLEGQVITIYSREIRFTKDEIISYFGAAISEDYSAAHIEKQTEGWPVALRLMKNAGYGENFHEGKGKNKLFDYLADEVLRHHPDHIRHFLLATSVLEILTAEYCDSLLEKKGSGKILEFLNKQQLFVTSLSGGAYRYHQLFREFLLNRLGEEDKQLFSRAADIALQTGDTDKAVEYNNIAGNHEKVFQLIIENGKDTLGQGRWQTVRKWLSLLSPDRVNREPWLILFQAEIHIYTGNLIEADPLLKKAAALFEKQNNPPGLSETLGQQARLLRSRGYHSESIRLLDRSLSLTGKSEKRFDFSIEKGFTLALAGKFKEAEAELTEGIKIAEEKSNEYLIANFAESLSNLYFLMGDYSKSMEMYRRAVNVSKEPIQTNYYMRDSIALIYRDWGELDKALEQAQRSIAVKEKLGLVEVLPYAYYQLAAIQADMGNTADAEYNYRRSINIARETGGEQTFLIMSLAMLAKLLLAQNKFVEAESLTEEAIKLSGSQSPYVMAFTNEMAAPVLLGTGRAQEAVQMLFESAAVLEQVGAKYPLCIAHGALTAVLLMKGDRAAAAEHARKCLEPAAGENYLQIFISSYDLFHPVLKTGLEQGIEVLFIHRVLVRLGRRAVELLSGLAAAAVPEMRERAIIPLAEIGGREAEKIIRSLTEDNSPRVKELAVRMARSLGIMDKNKPSAPVIPLLRFDMLGSLKIYINGKEATTSNWKTLKSRDLLVYLAHCGEAVIRDRIQEHLWPGMDCDKSSQLFHTTLYYLRQTIFRACGRRDIILYAGGKYRLKEETYITDRGRFERLLNTARNAGPMPEISTSFLSEAAALYRGDYLTELDYSWLILAREQLELSYVQVLKQLGNFYIEKNDYGPAVRHLHVLSRYDPFAEDVFRMLMKAYAGAGNMKMVSETYQNLVNSLNKELGISPSAETVELFNSLTEAKYEKK
ncbi:MAG: tetratricopeptide repeat protein [Spirochaetes bacterium]|nr:tetratricopeptide repeat protein [Spirochaetota bacterium]